MRRPSSIGENKLDRRSLLPIILIVFTNILGAGVIIPVLPLYAEGEFAGSVFQITLLSTAFFGAQMVAAPLLGRLSDRFGRRPVLLLSQIGTILSFILFIFAAELGNLIAPMGAVVGLTGGMAMLYIARTLDGITGGNITTAQAWISDKTDDEYRAEALGLLQAAFGAGFIFGPAFGGFLAQYGPRWPFIGAATITTGTFLLTYFTLEESVSPSGPSERGQDQPAASMPLRALLRKPTVPVILGIAFFATLAFAALPATFSLYADRVLFAGTPEGTTERNIGLMLAFHGVMTVLTQLALLRPLIKKLGERRLLLVGQISLIAAQWLIVPAENALLVTVLFAPFALGQGVSDPTQQALITRFGDPRSSGQLLGIWQSARSAALIVGPLWAGFVFEAYGPRSVFAVGGGIVVVALGFAFALQIMDIPPPRPARPVQDPPLGTEMLGTEAPKPL
ncbi:MAG: MFS transporter [Anaerolineales bacterium]